MSKQKELLVILEEIEERANKATDGQWRSHYLRHYCPGTASDLGGGLHVISGIPKCLHGKGECNGHDNENWSSLNGPETYREYADGPQYIYSNDAMFIASARTDVPLLVKALRRAIEQLTEVSQAVEYGPNDGDISWSHKANSADALSDITAILNGEEEKKNQNFGEHRAV